MQCHEFYHGIFMSICETFIPALLITISSPGSSILSIVDSNLERTFNASSRSQNQDVKPRL